MLAGKLTVRFAIDELGNVVSCEVMQSSLHDEAFEQQAVSVVSRWKFGKIDMPGDVTTIVYPFVFSR